MFGLSDIVALAKSGYSVSDVKELITLSRESGQQEQSDNTEHKTNKQSDSQTETQQEVEPETKDEHTTEVIADTKIKELEATIKELQTQLAEAQKNNINKDRSPEFENTDPFSAFAELFK